MNRRVAAVVSLLLLFLPPLPSSAVTTTDLTQVTPLQLAQALAGPGVTVSNVTFTGANVSAGTFTGGLADGLGIDSGIILSSGDIANAAGPNQDDGETTTNKTPGDPDLNAIVGEPHTTFDAAVLEFDFIPSSSTVQFRYVFASEEYNEFVGFFNDVFAFFIDGQNVALIPGTTTPVAINTVNLQTNSSFFRNNDLSDLGLPTPFGTEFDGFTTVLTATATLTPKVSHHIKLAIADTDDFALDSAVFLQAASFTSQTLTISKTAPESVTSGQNLTYTLTYGNVGEASAADVVILDQIPQGTVFVSATNGGTVTEGGFVSWDIGTLPGGTTGQTVSFTVRVDATSGTIQNLNYSIDATGQAPVNGQPVSTQVVGGGCGTITLSPASLPSGTAGSPYAGTITASGGTAPFSFAVTAGTLPPGLSLSSGGAISGTPTQTGAFSFTVTATDADECSGSRAYTISIGCGSIALSPPTLPSGALDAPYSRTITASGGRAPLSFAITGGALPPGLSLSAGGAISGTPTQVGEFTFTVTATDASQCTGSRTYTISISSCAAVSISPSTLANATIGSTFRRVLQGTGGTAPYTFQRSSGSFPPGVTLSSAGVLSGRLSTTGTFIFTITATDANGCSGSVTYTLRVACPNVSVLPATLPAAALGAAYSQTLTASDGREPHTFAVTGGALPTGLALSADGILAGMPTATGTFSFTVTATDSAGCSGSRTYAMSVCVTALTISPAALPPATVGVAYSQAVTASGGAGPFTFSSTALPPGLALNPATGVISGTPTAAGTFAFTVTATDAVGCPGVREYTFTVCPAVAIGPASLPPGAVGVAYSQNLTVSGGAPPFAFAVTAGALPSGVALSSAGLLVGTPQQSGSFSFTVTSTDAAGCTASRAYALTVTDAPPVITDLTLSPAGPGEFTLAITGTGFADGAVVLVNGVPSTATFVSPTLLLVTLPTSAVPTTGSITVTVTNPGATGATSNPATLIFCEPPQAPSNLEIRPAGNPSGPLTATDFLQVSWDPPAAGPAPAFYEFRINGDAYTQTTGTSAVVPPRGSSDPITLFVRAHCNGGVAGPEVASATFSLGPPVADFTFSAARVGSPVVFTDTSSPQATSWLWIFDDGATSTLQSPTHTFTTAGTHRVALIATNGSGSSQRIREVPVSAATASAGVAMSLVRPFSASARGRWRLPYVEISGADRVWLELRSEEPVEAIVYLRYLDAEGRPILERRLSVAPGERAVNDLGAYGVEGSYTLEVVSSQRISPRLTEGPRKRKESGR